MPAALLMISTVVFAHLVYFQLHLPGAGGGGLGVGFRVLLVLKGPQGTGLSLSLPLPLPLSLLQCGCGCLRLFFWHGRRVQQMHVLPLIPSRMCEHARVCVFAAHTTHTQSHTITHTHFF